MVKYLADSNVVIDYLGEVMPSPALDWLDRQAFAGGPALSIISKMEVLGFHFSTEADEIRFIEFFAKAELLPLNEAIVAQTIALRKAYRIKLPDAIIAATALVNDWVLISHNVADFQKIAGLALLDPYTLPEILS